MASANRSKQQAWHPQQGVRCDVAACQHYAKRHQGWDTGWRSLPISVVETPHGGSWEVFTENEHMIVEEGQGFFISADARHRLVSLSDMRSSWCYLVCQWNGIPITLGHAAKPLAQAEATLIEQLSGIMQNAKDDPTLPHALRSQILSLQILEQVLEQFNEGFNPEPRIVRVIKFIQENLDRPMSRTELAEVACLSETRFHEVFSQTVGEAPMQWVQRCRLQRATTLLLNSSSSVSQIAQLCGYESLHYFSRVFHKHTGVSPRDFRRRNQAGR